MGYCLDCGKELHGGHGKQRCEECAQLRIQDSHGYPKYLDFARTLTLDEIRALVCKYRKEIKFVMNDFRQVLKYRTFIKILIFAYQEKNEELQDEEY